MNIISKKYIATSSIVVLGSLVIQRALPYADRNGLFLLLLIGCILYSSYQFSAAKRQTQRNKDKSGSETTAAIPIAPGAVPLLGVSGSAKYFLPVTAGLLFTIHIYS